MNSPEYEIAFKLSISVDQYLRYYRGEARHVLIYTREGRTIQFPANLLRRFVDDNGVHGSFLLRYDKNSKLVSLERIADGK